MDACTRPSHQNRQAGASKCACLAVVFVALLSVTAHLPVNAATTTEITPDNEYTGTIAPSSAHDVETRAVRRGEEQVTLQARLTDTHQSLISEVRWRVFDAFGEEILNVSSDTTSMPLAPGDYLVEARLGSITLNEGFTLAEGSALRLTFVLNGGALRILPRIKDLAAQEINSRSLVYALSGTARGRLVAESIFPGEVLTLAAGQYRIENRLGLGNAVAIMDVKVRPGVMSAVEIDHKVGLARLTYVGQDNAEVLWEIRQGDHVMLTGLTDNGKDVVLRAGDYTALVHVSGKTHSSSFTVEPGAMRNVIIGE